MGRHNNYHQPYSASNYIIFLEDKIEKQDAHIEQLEAQTEAVLTIIGNLKWLSEWERTEIMKAIIPKEKDGE